MEHIVQKDSLKPERVLPAVQTIWRAMRNGNFRCKELVINFMNILKPKF